MNASFQTLSATQLTCAFLDAGRSPAAWLHFIADVATRVNVLSTRSKWITFPERVRPRLREGPLLGVMLEIVTHGSMSLQARQAFTNARRNGLKPTEMAARRQSRRRRGL